MIRPDGHGTCTNPPFDDGAPCDDGNACTQYDVCQAGNCTGAPRSCAPADGCHLEGSCDPVSGACLNSVVADGTACEDGDLCTNNTTCRAGACKGGTLKLCEPTDQCHADGACNPADGVCTNPPRPDQTPCDDGNACTMGDLCVQGTCQPGPAQTCTASDACHLAGTCDSATGACSNPLDPSPSCAGYQPPPVKAPPQGAPGLVPQGSPPWIPGPARSTVTPAGGAGGPNSPTTAVVIPALIGAHTECTADVTGDTMTDLVFTDTTTGKMRYLPRRDPEALAYGAPVDIDLAVPAGEPGAAACADLDGDGVSEIVASFATPDGGGSTTLVVYRPTTGQKIVVPHGFPAGVAVGGLAFADFDGDGRRDLAAYAANDQPLLLGSQLFVFPNGGFFDSVTSGQLNQPFSQATRVSVPQTNVLASAETPNWGSLTTLDADGDPHPDIWALGNRGIVLLYRSNGGFEFAAPELVGVVTDLAPKFTIGALDTNGDQIPDLIASGLNPGIPSKVFPGLGGGRVVRFPRARSLETTRSSLQ